MAHCSCVRRLDGRPPPGWPPPASGRRTHASPSQRPARRGATGRCCNEQRAGRRETAKGRGREESFGRTRTPDPRGRATNRRPRRRGEPEEKSRGPSKARKNLPTGGGGAPGSLPYPGPSVQGGESICEWTGDKRGRRTQKNLKTRARETAPKTQVEPAGRFGRRTRRGGRDGQNEW